jgi:exopolysaccharide biosynthesis protein
MSAGPLLLKNGVYYSGTDEMFNDNILYVRHPRSAVCKTNKGKLVFMAIDGRR